MTKSRIAPLRRALSKGAELFTPDSPGYDEKRAVPNRRFDKRPAVIVTPATNADVSAAVQFAGEQGLVVSPRSGGLSPAGFSSNDGGVMIDLSKLQSIRIDQRKRTARIGTGVLLEKAYASVSRAGLVLVGGECKPVGLSGLALGGGFSLLSRSLGLACDNIVGATVVTPDGRCVKANDDEHPDLFWALRGGGGNFGVVTQLDVRLHELPPKVLCSMLVWPLDQAADVLVNGLHYFATEAPDEIDAFFGFSTEPTGERVLLSVGVYCGPPKRGEQVIKRLTSLGKPTVSQVTPEPFGEIMVKHFPAPVDRIHDYFKSGFVDGPLPRSAAELLVERFRDTRQDGSRLQNMVFFEMAGGAINRVAPDATAFVHRRHSYMMSLLATWQGARGDNDPAEKRWADDLRKDLDPYYSDGHYQNYPDIELKDPVRAYFGANLERLMSVKRLYDPDNLFRFAQSIPLK